MATKKKNLSSKERDTFKVDGYTILDKRRQEGCPAGCGHLFEKEGIYEINLKQEEFGYECLVCGMSYSMDLYLLAGYGYYIKEYTNHSAQEKILRDALMALRLRIHFIGWPNEPKIDRGDGVMVPDWRKEIKQMERALFGD